MKHAENGLMRIKIKIGAPPQTPEFIALYFKAAFFIKNSRSIIKTLRLSALNLCGPLRSLSSVALS